jgi:ATP-dependent Clp protease ATP-binding subunit ClpA
MSEPETSSQEDRSDTAPVAKFTDLTQIVANAPGDARLQWSEDTIFDGLMSDMARVLFRGQGNHVVLSTERGADVESWITEFAYRARRRPWMPFLSSRRIIVADVRFTLAEESRERLIALLQLIGGDPSLVVFLPGFASCLRGARGVHSDVLLAGLGAIQCQLIPILTQAEYEETMAGYAEFEEYFTRLEFPEPNQETAARIVESYAESLQNQFGFAISAEMVKLTVTLASNYVLNERLPGKARRILKRVCQDTAFENERGSDLKRELESNDLIEAVARETGIPGETLRGIAAKQDYFESLREYVVGQDHALREISVELGLIKSGLSDPGKPASVLMFVGQTGTGKTELAKALARFYSGSKRLRTYTLGNMAEPHSVSAIIGVPPGYVGHDRGGRIVHDLQSDPYSVFLLDEADKAHPDVLQPFLNLFDEGWIQDQRGVQAFAERAIFILTTNVGQRMISDMAKQGKSPEEMVARMKETLAQIKHPKSQRPVFAPEFLARITRLIVFQPLTLDAMRGIAEKTLRGARRNWREKREKELEVAPRLIDAIAAESHRRNTSAEGREGGRIVRKLFAEFVDAKIQAAIAEDPAAYLHSPRTVVLLEEEVPEVPAEKTDVTLPADGKPAENELEKLRVRVRFLGDGLLP